MNEPARIDLESGDLDDAYKWYQTGHEAALRKPNLKDAEQDLWESRWEHAQARIAARRANRDKAQKHVAAAKMILDKGGNPDQARFYPYLAGYVAFYAGDYKTAIVELQNADQRDPFILSLLAQACEKSGDQAQAWMITARSCPRVRTTLPMQSRGLLQERRSQTLAERARQAGLPMQSSPLRSPPAVP